MCQKRELERQHKNVAVIGIFSMLALRPKRGGRRGEKREKKEGRKRSSFIFILKSTQPASPALQEAAGQTGMMAALLAPRTSLAMATIHGQSRLWLV